MNNPAIYVDEAIWPYRNALYCHCMIDRNQPIETLHRFIESIGLKRRYFQNKTPSLAHYDLSPRMRKAAIAAGAIETDAVTMIRRCRRGKRPMSPKPLVIEESEYTARLKPDWETAHAHGLGAKVDTIAPNGYCNEAVDHASYELASVGNRDEYLCNRFFKIRVTTELIPIEADDMPWSLVFDLYNVQDDSSDAAPQIMLATPFEWARDLLDTAKAAYGLGDERRLRVSKAMPLAYARPVPTEMVSSIISDYGLSSSIETIILPAGIPASIRWYK